MEVIDKQSLLETKLVAFMKKILKLDDDVELKVDGDLVDQVGLDSIEAFDAVATLHEILGVSIPDDFNAKLVSSLRQLGEFISGRYPEDVVARFLDADLDKLEFGWGDDE